MYYWAAFILGLAGSLHCAGMCGPLALALPGRQAGGAGFLLSRVAYNLGRIVTYCCLGVLFGLLGQGLLLAGIQRWVSLALGIALLAGLFSSRKLAVWAPATTLVEASKARMSALLRRRSLATLGLLGLLNGLLPCGLVYVACAGAVATGGTLAGAHYMAAFGAGTVPMMLALSLSGRLVPVSLRLQLRRLVPVSVFLIAALLILRGMALGIPYVSPSPYSATGAACCHR